MPRTARADRGGIYYHVMSRGNAKGTVFHDSSDYDAFVSIIGEAMTKRPTRLVAWCLMPNHFHLVAQPYTDGDLGAWMHWMLTTHVTRHRRRYDTTGRIWQGRFKCFPIQVDAHLLTVLRYVERNPLRASLVAAVQDWPWCSLRARWTGASPLPLSEPPVPLPERWIAWVQTPLTEAELAAVRGCARREQPYGDDAWRRITSDRLSLEGRAVAPGRPRTIASDSPGTPHPGPRPAIDRPHGGTPRNVPPQELKGN